MFCVADMGEMLTKDSAEGAYKDALTGPASTLHNDSNFGLACVSAVNRVDAFLEDVGLAALRREKVACIDLCDVRGNLIRCGLIGPSPLPGHVEDGAERDFRSRELIVERFPRLDRFVQIK